MRERQKARKTRPAAAALLAAALAGLVFSNAGCGSDWGSWTEPDELKVKVLSGAMFVRTDAGDYIEGCLAEYDKELRPARMFMALELPRYAASDRLVVTGRFEDDFVRIPGRDPAPDKVPVFDVDKAKPNVATAPDIPPIK